MKHYPKFLRTLPEAFGLGAPEIGALLVTLYLGMVFRLSSTFVIAMAVVLIGLTKFTRRRFDLKALILPRKREITFQSNGRNNESNF